MSHMAVNADLKAEDKEQNMYTDVMIIEKLKCMLLVCELLNLTL